MRFLGAITLMGAGCSGISDGKSSDDHTGDTSEDSLGGGGNTDTGAALDSGVETALVWWQLRAEIHVEAGLPLAKSSALWITLLDGALREVCTASRTILAMEASDTVPDGSVFVWWQVEPGSGSGCEGQELPLSLSFGLGVGALHPDILARLRVEGIDSTALNGAYLAPSGEDPPLYVYGAAGTASAWEGKGAPVGAGMTLPDGLWELRPLSTFEYTP